MFLCRFCFVLIPRKKKNLRIRCTAWKMQHNGPLLLSLPITHFRLCLGSRFSSVQFSMSFLLGRWNNVSFLSFWFLFLLFGIRNSESGVLIYLVRIIALFIIIENLSFLWISTTGQFLFLLFGSFSWKVHLFSFSFQFFFFLLHSSFDSFLFSCVSALFMSYSLRLSSF